MTPEEQAIVKQKLREVASILYQDTCPDELKTFESVELSARKHLLETIAPQIGEFFYKQQEDKKQGEKGQ